MTARIDLDEVRSALSARALLDFYGWTFRRSGDELESRACPERADHSRRAFVINANTGRWQCFPCATSGDAFDFVAAVERLTMPRDFPAVLAKAAEIAGVEATERSPEERARERTRRAAERAASEARDREERRKRAEDAVPIATAHWDRLLREHERGLAYLRERAVEDVVAVVGDAVRFDASNAGSPALALFTSRGEIRNVVVRRVPELGEPKTPGLRACPTLGTFVNAVWQIEPDRDVVLTEGVMDSITARLAWRYAIILGAHGAGNLADVARAAAPAIVNVRARLIVVPHGDRRGYEESYAACGVAVEAGLSVRRGTLQVVRLPAKDLNDAWRRGWRPCAS